ncbi:MAG: AMP-binding protein [Desulfarculus sp.]|nr:AMP-binding protein [Desulfarculus sp.]
MKEKLPGLAKIIYTDPKGMRDYDDPLLIYFPEVEELGRQFEKEHPNYLENSIARLKPQDLALIAYTSGTTGFPKGSLLTHSNMLKMALNLSSVDPKLPDDEFVSFLPLPWRQLVQAVHLPPVHAHRLPTGRLPLPKEEPAPGLEDHVQPELRLAVQGLEGPPGLQQHP